MNSKIIKFLNQKNELEVQQLKSKHFIKDIPDDAWDISSEKESPILKKEYFLHNQSVYISKHNRFAPYPLHGHKFLEINYMLSGTCHQIVDGHLISLKTGDILLMNIGGKHSISALGEKDILINVLFTNQNINFKLLHNIHRNNSISYRFLANISLGQKSDCNYIIFSKENNSDIKITMEQIIEEYYLNQNYANSVVESYLNILLIKIIRHHPMPTNNITNYTQKLIFEILEDITENYQNITLSKIAKKYGYNKNYLSNLITKMTGQNFSNLKTEQRIIKANELLTSTSLSIANIMAEVGITNKNFFYRKYREYYHKLPSEQRYSLHI